jgi:hypothetical protein
VASSNNPQRILEMLSNSEHLNIRRSNYGSVHSFHTDHDYGQDFYHAVVKVITESPVRRRCFTFSLKLAVSLAIAVFAAVLYFYSIKRQAVMVNFNDRSSMSNVIDDKNTPTGYVIIATNEYGVFRGFYSWLSDIDALSSRVLIEPYKNTTLSLLDKYVKETSTYLWKIDGLEQEFAGTSIVVQVKKTGNYSLVITEYNLHGMVSDIYAVELICK